MKKFGRTKKLNYERKSIRYKEYAYTKNGLYFITICTNQKKCFFGSVKSDRMILNEKGMIADEYWLAIPDHFHNVILHEYIVMPNHVHGIIELRNYTGTHVGKRWCNKNGHEHFRWQTRFYDHIIRDEKSYQNISQYIINNARQYTEG
ncbi:MAG: hypothetical protein ABI462_05340 [Ignavibacteria bacterium]